MAARDAWAWQGVAAFEVTERSTFLHGAGHIPESAAAFGDAPHLARYYELHAARPSFARTVPPLGPPQRAKRA